MEMEKLTLYNKKKVVVGVKQNILAAIFAFAIMVPFSWMAGDREPAAIRHSGFVTPSVVAPGTEATVTWTVTIRRACDGEVRRVITDADGIEWRLAPVPSQVDRAVGKKVITRSFIIPLGAAPGPATYKSVVTSYCNPLHYIWPVVNEKPSVDFEIAKK